MKDLKIASFSIIANSSNSGEPCELAKDDNVSFSTGKQYLAVSSMQGGE